VIYPNTGHGLDYELEEGCRLARPSVAIPGLEPGSGIFPAPKRLGLRSMNCTESRTTVLLSTLTTALPSRGRGMRLVQSFWLRNTLSLLQVCIEPASSGHLRS
jgi:hypothetical protein